MDREIRINVVGQRIKNRNRRKIKEEKTKIWSEKEKKKKKIKRKGRRKIGVVKNKGRKGVRKR